MPDGPGGFTQDYTCPALLRIPLGRNSIHVQDCHLLRLNFPDHSILDLSATTWSYNPASASLHLRFGLFPGRSPLLGESLLFSLPGGTKMFQFPPFASIHLRMDNGQRPLGCPIRKSRDQGIFAPTPRLSQLITSFVASVSLGIRHPPFFSFTVS